MHNCTDGGCPYYNARSIITAFPSFATKTKMTDQTVEYRCIITLPQAEVFDATDVLNLMALAVRNRDNDAP